ncbi:LPXTG cell wall anchor domain-containing protein [Streptomyces sp. NPDC029004]|uniref:LPXTG cell wall anchor domain-containing protein n=1 Tax=Streptomyces sp. NPDC029004 TaxID=3154490 RepID=UPI0033E14423
MAVAAATAVIAPAAFLSAPAAFATETPVATESPSAEAPSSSPSETASASPSETVSSTPSATATTPAADQSSTPAATPSTPATSSAATPSATASEPGEDDEFECEEGSVQVSLGGFPNKIVAGTGWKNFTFNVKNNGKTDIESLLVYTVATYADSLENPDADDKLVAKYAHFEYKDPESGKWVNDLAGSGFNNGVFFGEFPLDAGKKVTIDLRVKIDKAAPAGDGLAIAAGTYDNGAEDDSFKCYDNGNTYPFAIVKAGSNPGDVDDSKPNGQKPDSDVKPQGGAKELPVTGNLASTGSSSMLPTVGIAGGIAVVAGAGVVFAMKRRRSGDATA